MSEDSERFRKRAGECRALAAGARNALDRLSLEHIAEELDEEAAKIEAEEDASKAKDE